MYLERIFHHSSEPQALSLPSNRTKPQQPTTTVSIRLNTLLPHREKQSHLAALQCGAYVWLRVVNLNFAPVRVPVAMADIQKLPLPE